MAGTEDDRGPHAARAPLQGCCEQCGEPFRGWRNKRYGSSAVGAVVP